MQSALIASFVLALVLSVNAFDPETDVKLNLFTRKNPTNEQIIENGNLQNLTNSNFQLNKGLKVFIHGWINRWQEPGLVSAFLNSSDLNVLLVDWTPGVEGEEVDVVARAPGIGRFVAKFIDWVAQLGVSYDDVQIIGVSLGSHISGWTGRSCKNKVGYITVCDPSRRFWDNSTDRINAGDAKYVEVIHSNTGKHGLIYPTGTADFYPNGGVEMPGCENDPQQLCSHGRGMDYFRDSIDHQRFASIKCNNYDEIANGNCANIGRSYMGGSSPKTISGIFYLETNAEQPFYKG